MMKTEFRLTVNGAERSVTCEPDTPLLDVLRHDVGLAGPRFGCGMGCTGRASPNLPLVADVLFSNGVDYMTTSGAVDGTHLTIDFDGTLAN